MSRLSIAKRALRQADGLSAGVEHGVWKVSKDIVIDGRVGLSDSIPFIVGRDAPAIEDYKCERTVAKQIHVVVLIFVPDGFGKRYKAGT